MIDDWWLMMDGWYVLVDEYVCAVCDCGWIRGEGCLVSGD